MPRLLHGLWPVICIGLAALEGTAMAQESTPPDSPEVTALKEQIAKANAEKDLAVAQLARLQAEKNLSTATAPPDAAAQAAAQVAAEKARAEAQKALADAQKAVFDQQKAAADAQAAVVAAEQAALKARFGTVTGSQAHTGAVELGDGAGNGEASMLAAHAIQDAAKHIAAKVKAASATGKASATGAATTTGKASTTSASTSTSPAAAATYVIYAGQQKPTFGRWNAFRVQMEIARDSFERAAFTKTQADEIAKPPATDTSKGAGMESVGTFITGAGAVLDLGAKLGSYFQSDYKVMGATIAGSDDDLLAISVAGHLENSWYPARWVPQTATQPIATLLKPLAATRESTITDLQAVQQNLTRYKADSEKETDARKKQRLNDIVAAYTRAADAYAAAQKRFDDLLVSLAAVTDGVPLAVHIADEKTISEKLESGASLVFLRLNAPAGGRYTKKNLWTFFGGMPFFVSGGTIASYLVVDPKSGNSLAAGQFTVHSGYHKLNEVAAKFQ
jgi:hypothetical protein